MLINLIKLIYVFCHFQKNCILPLGELSYVLKTYATFKRLYRQFITSQICRSRYQPSLSVRIYDPASKVSAEGYDLWSAPLSETTKRYLLTNITMTTMIITHIQHRQALRLCSCNLSDSTLNWAKFFSAWCDDLFTVYNNNTY